MQRSVHGDGGRSHHLLKLCRNVRETTRVNTTLKLAAGTYRLAKHHSTRIWVTQHQGGTLIFSYICRVGPFFGCILLRDKTKNLLQAYSNVAARLLRRNSLPQNLEKVCRTSPLAVMFLRPLPKHCHRHQKLYYVLPPATGSPEKHQNAIKHHRFAKIIIFSVSIVTIWY